MIPEEREIS